MTSVYGACCVGAAVYMRHTLTAQFPNLAAEPMVARYFLLVNCIAWTAAILCGCITCLLARSRSQSTIRIVIAGLWVTGPVVLAALTHLPYMVNPSASYAFMDSWLPVLYACFWPGIWTAYLLTAKRVKNTYRSLPDFQ